MEGLLKEGDEVVKEAKKDVRDAGLISAAQRVEHYEMAGYGCARTYAQLLRDSSGAKLLDTSLQEEGRTDKKLTSLARSVINLRARKQKKTKDEDGGVISRIVRKIKGR